MNADLHTPVSACVRTCLHGDGWSCHGCCTRFEEGVYKVSSDMLRAKKVLACSSAPTPWLCMSSSRKLLVRASRLRCEACGSVSKAYKLAPVHYPIPMCAFTLQVIVCLQAEARDILEEGDIQGVVMESVH